MTIQSGQFESPFGTIPQEKGRQVVLCLMALSLLFAATSCRRRVDTSTEPGAVRPLAKTISEVDALYTGRGNLTRVRQGLVALRQAQASVPANYELAWRLAKFDYYLGSH